LAAKLDETTKGTIDEDQDSGSQKSDKPFEQAKPEDETAASKEH
jgi:hypothetical protein